VAIAQQLAAALDEDELRGGKPQLVPPLPELGASNEELRGLIEGLPGFVYRCPLRFTQSVYVSPQVFDLTGYTPEEHVGARDHWFSRVHPDDQARVHEAFTTAMAAGDNVTCEYRYVHRDGRVRWFRDHAGMIRGDHRQGPFYQGVVFDITEAKEAELARAESVAKSRFLAGLSHELRNPLNSVIGFAELLESKELGGLGERQSRYVRNIRQSGQLLLELVNDVLDFSKMQAGQMKPEIVPLAVAEAVEDAVERMLPIADARAVALVIADSCSGAVALADRRRLTQVLLNLISNAIKFTPAGGTVKVECGCIDGMVEVSVRDTGIGIPPEQLGAIFHEFVQVDNEQTRTQTGTGLGLALSQGLMQLMDGTISVTSEVGKGSCFTLRLQAAESRTESRDRAVA
jgi:PAS domain S-box-containing protein